MRTMQHFCDVNDRSFDSIGKIAGSRHGVSVQKGHGQSAKMAFRLSCARPAGDGNRRTTQAPGAKRVFLSARYLGVDDFGGENVMQKDALTALASACDPLLGIGKGFSRMLSQALQKEAPIILIQKIGFPSIASRQHVIIRYRKFNAHASGHAPSFRPFVVSVTPICYKMHTDPNPDPKSRSLPAPRYF